MESRTARGAKSALETPMMTQYLREKARHPDTLLLFRMGDFYETFFEDAQTLARVTGIALTSRNSKDPDPIPLAGFPWHSAEPHLAKLLRAGHRVAICEQVEEPGPGRKLLERKVVEVLSPGTTLGDSLLDAKRNNFIAALRLERDRIGLAAADVSTGELRLGDLARREAEEELRRLAPAEILLAESDRAELEPWVAALELDSSPFRSFREAWAFGRERGARLLAEQLRVVTLDGLECQDLGPGLGAAGALLDYVREQKQTELGHLRRLVRIRPSDSLLLDDATLRSLEILEGLPGAGREATLLGVLDRTQTAAGARRLRAALRRPFVDPGAIEARLDGVTSLLDTETRAVLRAELSLVSDLERILARVHCGKATPRDLAALRDTLAVVPRVTAVLRRLEPAMPDGVAPPFPGALSNTLHDALVDRPPALLADGGIFQDAWDAELAELRSLSRDAKGWIARLQEDERKRTGISTLKVGFNRVFGYYLEVSQSQLAKVPEHYQRKQTLAGAERFLTPELKDFEQRVLSAEEGQVRRERALFDDLLQRVMEATADLQALAALLADLDLLQSLAEVAKTEGWTRPHLRDDLLLRIEDGRHPAVESAVGRDRFVPNDVDLDGEARQLVVLTGPNMAGKSTFLRQVGILTLLAQVGSYVPARRAEIGLVDRIFTRVGAQDSLARGQSTFLVEMVETSRILHHATRRSLVLLDEVGRGTSTYDGLAIAWAVAEALSSEAGERPRTIFATHFHELTRLAAERSGVVNQNVLVKEWNDRIVFLHKIGEGGADRSYGIHVAQLAGVPDPVVARAREVLQRLERASRASALDGDAPTLGRDATGGRPRQLSLFEILEPEFLRELAGLDLDRLSPLDALGWLHRWGARLGRGEPGASPQGEERSAPFPRGMDGPGADLKE